VDDQADDELLRAWAEGNARAGATLVERHYDSVVRLFRFKVGEQQGWDLTQATFEAAQKALPSFRRDSSFRTWLFGVARNKLLNYMRSRGRDNQRFDPDASSVADLGPSPSTVLDAKQRDRLLLAALRRLPVDVQLMLELHYWEKLPIAEIAKIVEKPANTVKTQMRRGRQRLDELMAELAETPEHLETTRSGLEGWAERVRQECANDE
jgi:RNA polymerase sigma factor (sigma-70 family)